MQVYSFKTAEFLFVAKKIHKNVCSWCTETSLADFKCGNSAADKDEQNWHSATQVHIVVKYIESLKDKTT